MFRLPFKSVGGIIMPSVNMYEHVKELQQHELAKIFYKITTFVASAILCPLLLYFIINVHNTLDKLAEGQAQVRTDIAVLKDRLNIIGAYSNASLDAAKAQIRETNASVTKLSDSTSSLLTYLVSKSNNPPKARRKKVKHAARN